MFRGKFGRVHFVGIGGSGMSGIAEVLMTQGFRVQGSDAKASKITDRLASLGATVFEGQAASNIGEASVVVVSTAIKKGNPEAASQMARNAFGQARADATQRLAALVETVATRT